MDITEQRNSSGSSSEVYSSMTISELQKWTDSSVKNPTPQAKVKERYQVNTLLNYHRVLISFWSCYYQIDWLQYLNSIFSSSSITISRNDRVVVIEKDFLKVIL